MRDLADAVINMDDVLAKKAALAAIEAKIDPYEAIMSGLTSGMNRANELFEQEEYFVPKLLLIILSMVCWTAKLSS